MDYGKNPTKHNFGVIPVLIFGLIISIIFLIIAGFSFSVFIIFIFNIIGLLLLYYKKPTVLPSYCLICETMFIVYFLLEIQNWPLWLMLIATAMLCYFIFYNLSSSINNIENSQIKIVYSLILSLAFSELLIATNFLNMAILIKSLIITAVFYYFSGLIQLEHQNKTSLNSVSIYSTIFSVIILVLVNIGRI